MILAYYYLTFYTSTSIISKKNVTTFIKTEQKELKLQNQPFTIKAINIGSAIPGHDDKEFSITKQTYLKWFSQISDMNINTIRVFTIESPEFYKALKEYNKTQKKPLYLIQGIDAGDYEKNSSVDYFHESLKNSLINDSKVMIDVIHGKKIINYNAIYASGSFDADVSEWTIGYIIGTEWNDVTVEYTNRNHKNDHEYHGKYIKTTKEATPFERVLAEIGDTIFAYESNKYGTQRLLSFGNAPTTDPFTYDEAISDFFNKFTTVDISRLETTNKVKSGLFASFAVYTGYPDYYSLNGEHYQNSYKEYLKSLYNHYKMPIVISEFGYSTARGETINFQNEDYGHSSYTEEEQGEMIVKAIQTIQEVGINNFILYEWQDEWDKNVWNTMYSIDVTRSQYWHDIQTSTNSFGILTFENGKKETPVILDGKKDEWKKEDQILNKNGFQLSSKYDTTYLYLLIEKENLEFEEETIYLPIDITPKTGSKTSKFDNLKFDRAADFIIKINGSKNSKIVVQDRYNPLRAMYGKQLYWIEPFEKGNIPKKDSSNFEDIELITSFQNLNRQNGDYQIENKATVVKTGNLIYGISDPNHSKFNSLSDFYANGNIIEIRIPWGILNFSDPSLMMIHDDYYEHYGVEDYHINQMHIGIGTKENTIPFGTLSLKGWKERITYHERLKKSYDIIKNALKEE